MRWVFINPLGKFLGLLLIALTVFAVYKLFIDSQWNIEADKNQTIKIPKHERGNETGDYRQKI